MSEALLGLNGKSVSDKIIWIREVCAEVVKSTIYTTPVPTVIEILAETLILEQDEAATKTTKKDAVQIRDLQLEKVMGIMKKFLSYVQTTSGGDATKIGSILLKVKSGSKPPQRQEKVTYVKGKTGDYEGEVKLRWKSLRKFGAKFYQIQYSADGDTEWINKGVNVSEAKATVTGLIPEKRGYFRIAAGNKLGLGPWSDVIKVVSM